MIRKHTDRQYKVTGPFRSDATQYANEEELRIFQSTVYYVAKWKPLGDLVADVSGKLNGKLQRYNCSDSMEHKKHEHEETQHSGRWSESPLQWHLRH